MISSVFILVGAIVSAAVGDGRGSTDDRAQTQRSTD